ncbi:MAG TPA: hypothetical protein VMU58_07805 [Gaiellaceae bacterium]|nr:hypothetical protein [Gaiellaceae bacterium]
MRFPKLPGRSGNRAPLGIAAFIGIPLFFSSLMASTLAVEKPHTIQWRDAGRLLTTWHDPTSSTVARAWLWAMVPPLVLLAIGAIATRLPLGFYVPCLAAVPIAMAVVHKTATWARHHTARFPNGVDLIPASDPQSNKYDPGQWEQMARQTAVSLQHWTIALGLASAAVMALLYVRRRFFARRPVLASGQLEGIHAPDATPPGL